MTAMIRRCLKTVFRPDRWVEPAVQLLNTFKYAWGLKPGSALILDQHSYSDTLSGRMTGTVMVLTVFMLFVACAPNSATANSVLKVGEFSASADGQAFPQGWEPLTFKKIERHTRYRLIQDRGTWVVAAQSAASASGLIRRLEIDLHQFPILRWRWKISGVLAKGDVTRKAGDDYPARIYITFRYDPSKLSFLERAKYKAARLIYGEYPPTGALTYLWANKAPSGTIVNNPYTDRVKMIVLQSGSARKMQWVEEKRNVYEDYGLAFGQEPPLVSGVALMTDTDNTGESVSAYYGDIIFSSE